MATSLRKKIGSAIVLAFLGLAVIAMVVTGFGTDGMGGLGGVQGGGTALARVEGQAITETEVADAVARQFRQAQQQQPDLTMAQFLEGGTFRQLVNQLVVGAALSDFAGDQGLVVSEQMVDRVIVGIPAFRNFTGRFDEATFRQALAQQNMTEAQLREEIRRSLLQQQLMIPITLGARVPERIATQYAALLLERRRGTIGVVPAELLAQGIDPSPEEVAAFYRDNRERFVIPERRVIRYAMLDRGQVAERVEVTEAEIAAQYRQNQAQYGPRERRSLQQVVVPDQAAARGFMQRLQGGASFAEAASQAGFAPADIDLGTQTPESFAEVANQEIAGAAFAAEEGAVVGPIRSEFGYHIVRIAELDRTPAQPLSAVRDEIAAQIRERKVDDALNGLIDRIQELADEGAGIEEIARATGLELRRTPPVTAAGRVPGQAEAPEEVTAVEPVLPSAFELAEEDPPVIESIEQNRRFAVLGVDQVVPAAAPPLAQISDQVRQALVRQRALERAREIARTIQQRIEGGMAPRQAFAQAGVPLPPPQEVNLRRMDISQGGQRVPPPLALLFGMPEGGARTLEAPDQAGWFVVHHAERTPGNPSEAPELIDSVRQELATGAGDEIAQQFARAIEIRSEVERDEEAIERARRRLAGATD